MCKKLSASDIVLNLRKVYANLKVFYVFCDALSNSVLLCAFPQSASVELLWSACIVILFQDKFSV